MESSLYIRIRKRNHPGYLILLIALLPFCFGFLNNFLMLPYGIRYVLDLAWMCLLYLLIYYQYRISFAHIRPLYWWVLGFFAASAVLYVFRFQSLLYYLWGVRNNFRFYPFFLACCIFLTNEDVEDYFKIFDILFWVNFVITLFQYAILGLRDDYLGGLFGTEKGCNGYTNIFLVLILTKSAVYFLNHRENVGSFAAKCATAMLMSGLVELKFFFVEFIVIILMAVLLTNFSWRNLLIILGGAAALILGAILLIKIYPIFANSMSLQGFYQMSASRSGYTGRGDLNRLTVIPLVNRWFLRTPTRRWFGLGLGNCDTSKMGLLNTYFYKRYAATHYTWLSTAFIYLEMGYVGLVFLFGFFVMNYLMTAKIQKKGEADICYCQISKIISVCAMLILVYNSSMRTEAAYMIYLVLSFPYLMKRKQMQQKNTEKV